jgi:hypothetical protein
VTTINIAKTSNATPSSLLTLRAYCTTQSLNSNAGKNTIFWRVVARSDSRATGRSQTSSVARYGTAPDTAMVVASQPGGWRAKDEHFFIKSQELNQGPFRRITRCPAMLEATPSRSAKRGPRPRHHAIREGASAAQITRRIGHGCDRRRIQPRGNGRNA